MESEKERTLYGILKTAPKCQLHLHLDGSLSFDFIKRSFQRMKVADSDRARSIFPGDWEPTSPQELRDFVMELKKGSIKTGMVMKPCANWEVFDFCNNFLQTAEDLSDATCDLATRLYKEHSVNYIEIRFAPVLHTQCGLSMDDVVKAVIEGFEMAQTAYEEIHGGIILCALRSYPQAEAYKLIPLIESHSQAVGFDIAGDEKTYPLHVFIDVINECKSKNINVTVHAGEWPQTFNNVQLACELSVKRIGHGIAIKGAPSAFFQEISNKKIAVEVNLTANCANPLKVADFSDHPYPAMLTEKTIIAGLNCDNLLLSGNEKLGAPDPTLECVRALLKCNVSINELFHSVLGGYESGFSETADKAKNVFVNSWKEMVIPSLERLFSQGGW